MSPRIQVQGLKVVSTCERLFLPLDPGLPVGP
jgi:hypothetical protein